MSKKKKNGNSMVIKGSDLVLNRAGKLNRNDHAVKSGTGVWEDKSKGSKKKRRKDKQRLKGKISRRDYDYDKVSNM